MRSGSRAVRRYGGHERTIEYGETPRAVLERVDVLCNRPGRLCLSQAVREVAVSLEDALDASHVPATPSGSRYPLRFGIRGDTLGYARCTACQSPKYHASSSSITILLATCQRASREVVRSPASHATSSSSFLSTRQCRAFLGRRRGGERPARGKACHRAGDLRMDWTEPLPRRSAMGIASSGGSAGVPATGSCVVVAGRQRSVRMTTKAVLRPWRGVGDVDRPSREPRELRRVPGGRRWSRHDESWMAGAAHSSARPSTGCMFPS